MKSLFVVCITWAIVSALINLIHLMEDDIGISQVIYIVAMLVEISTVWLLWNAY